MSEVELVRNHGEPCEHGYRTRCRVSLCPGGALVTIDIEAASGPAIDAIAMLAAKFLGIPHNEAMQRGDIIEAGWLVGRASVDAALGLETDDEEAELRNLQRLSVKAWEADDDK